MAATIQTSNFQQNRFSLKQPHINSYKSQFNVNLAYNYGTLDNVKEAKLILETGWIKNRIGFCTNNNGGPILITVALDPNQTSCQDLTNALNGIANSSTGINQNLPSIIDQLNVSQSVKNSAKSNYKKNPITLYKKSADNPNYFPLINFKVLVDGTNKILTKFRHQSIHQDKLLDLEVNSFDDLKNKLIQNCEYRLVIVMERITLNKHDLRFGTKFTVLRVDIKEPIVDYPINKLPLLVQFHDEIDGAGEHKFDELEEEVDYSPIQTSHFNIIPNVAYKGPPSDLDSFLVCDEEDE